MNATNGHYGNGRAAEQERQLPRAENAERAALQSVIIDPSQIEILAAILRAVDFVDPASRVVYRQLLAMRADGQEIEPSLLISRLQEAEHAAGQSQFEYIGGYAYFAQLVESNALASNAAHYSKIVKDCSDRRMLIDMSNRISGDAYAGTTEPSKLLDMVASDLERMRPVAEARQRYPLLTCDQLDQTLFDLNYLVAGLMVAGQPCVFAGGKKCMKTTLLVALAISLAMGVPFLGRFEVERAVRVLVMTAESGLATIQETARRICKAMGIDLRFVENLFFTDTVPQLDNADDMDALRRVCEANQIDVLIIDPTYLAMPGADAGNLFIQGAMLRSINELCQSLGITLALAHHTKKGITDPYAPAELEDIAWAGFQEFCRQWVLLSRREKYEPGTGCHKLWLNAGGSAGHSSLWGLDISEGAFDGHTPRHWQVDVLRADEVRAAAQDDEQTAKEAKQVEKDTKRLESDCRKLIDVLLRHPDGATESRVGGEAGLNVRHYGPAFHSLKSDGHIVACDVKVSNQKTPKPGWKIANQDHSDHSDKATPTSAV